MGVCFFLVLLWFFGRGVGIYWGGIRDGWNFWWGLVVEKYVRKICVLVNWVE